MTDFTTLLFRTVGHFRLSPWFYEYSFFRRKLRKKLIFCKFFAIFTHFTIISRGILGPQFFIEKKIEKLKKIPKN